MEKLTNQMRYFGIKVRDDPTEDGLGIHSEEAYIPFHMNGIICMAETRTPTLEELTTCNCIELTSSNDWKPQDAEFRVASVYDVKTPATAVETTLSTSATSLEISSFVGEVAHSPRVANVGALKGSQRYYTTTDQSLSERWNIGLDQAENTLANTTQEYFRSGTAPLFRRYRRQSPHHRYNTDTLCGVVESYGGYKYAQVFTDKDLDFVYVVPMKENIGDEIRYTLLKFIEDVGVPEVLKSDRAASIMNEHVRFNRLCTNLGIKRRFFESYRHEGNRSESAIRELKRRWKFDMSRRTVPNRFWDFGLIYHAEI